MMEEAEDQVLLEAQGNEMNMNFIYFHMTVVWKLNLDNKYNMLLSLSHYPAVIGQIQILETGRIVLHQQVHQKNEGLVDNLLQRKNLQIKIEEGQSFRKYMRMRDNRYMSHQFFSLTLF